jgi:acetylglutamate kinase
MNTAAMQNLVSRAEVLVEALPYIRAFSGKYFVVKYGGQAMINEKLMASVIVDIVLLKFIGIKPVLVHGGGKEVNEIMHKLGKQPHFVDGLRVTDDETMEIVEMVLLGKVNRQIVSLINQQGGRSVGLSGRDAGLFQAKRKAPQPVNGSTPGATVDLGRVGDIVRVDPVLIHTLSNNGYIPVISSIGAGPSGESLNINADHVAGEMAAALAAEKLIILTDVEGVYKETGQGPEFISTVREQEVRALIGAGQINGGMIPKVEACLQALERGVPRTHIIDGRVAHALILEIFTDEGIGTMVIK